MKVYQGIAALTAAIQNCIVSHNYEWQVRHGENLDWILDTFMPSGSGVDCGTKLLEANDKRIVLAADFHHMDEHGYYDGWTVHTVVVKPSWDGFDIRITGRDRNGIKDYLAELFHEALNAKCRTSTPNGWEYGREQINTSGERITYDWIPREML